MATKSRRSVLLEDFIAKPRKSENADERADRQKREAETALEKAAASEHALDAMVRRSIERHGP
jgi:hypothetical protein